MAFDIVRILYAGCVSLPYLEIYDFGCFDDGVIYYEKDCRI